MLPNSSTTMARPVRRERNSSRSSLARLRFRNNEHVAQHRAQIKFGRRLSLLRGACAIEKNPDHVLDVHETEDVVERAFVDGNARALRGGEHAHRVFERGFDGQGVHVGTRNHHFAHLDLAQFHRALNEFHFGGGNKAAVVRLLDHYLQLFGGANECVAVRRNNAQRRDYFFGDAVEKIDGPAECLQEPIKRARN